MQVRRLTAADLDASWELDREAFHTPEEKRQRYLDDADPDEMVGVFEDGALVAQSRALALAQHFGGRAVPMGGLSSVATAPHARGRGFAARAVRGCLERMRERGDALSTLYPATTRLYRRLGWEVAGSSIIRRAPPDVFAALPRPEGVRVRRSSPDELAIVRASYERVAPSVNGMLGRSDARWRLCAAEWADAAWFVAEDAAGAVVGHLVYRQVAGEHSALGGPFGLVVLDHAAATRDALLALWGLLGSWATQVEGVVYRGPSEDPLLLLLPEQGMRTLAEVRWMTRPIDAAAAVAARGFAPGVEVEVPLRLRDAELPWNDGCFVLSVAKGEGRLEAGGDGAVELDVGAFAALYTGFADTVTLARTGRLTGGPPDARARLDAAFAGPTPWIPEEF